MPHKTRYGRSLWYDTFPASRRPSYPRYRGSLEVDVAIVGGGLAGCAIAQAFGAAGVKAALFERDRMGGADSAGSLGILAGAPEADFREVAGLHGLRVARRMFKTSRRAALDFAAALRRLGIRCDLAPADDLSVAVTQDDAVALRRQIQARRDAGLDVSWMTAAAASRAAGFPVAGGARMRVGFVLDPYRAACGLARAAAARGVALFERSEVVKVRPGRKAVELHIGSSRVRARTVVVATGRATGLFRPLVRHFKASHAYAVATPPMPAAIAREIARRRGVLRDSLSRTLRWTKDGRVIFSGAEQPLVPDRRRNAALVQRGGQLMYELSTLYPAISGLPAEYVWDAARGRTADGLPFIGPHRNYPRHLFALGWGGSGLELAHLAGRLLVRRYLGAPARGDEDFDFTRMLSIRH